MSKGKDLLKRKNNNEQTFDASSVLGAPILLDSQSDVTEAYLKSTEKKENVNLEQEIINNFNKIKENEIIEEPIKKEELQIEKDLIGLSPSDLYGDYEFNSEDLIDIINSEESALLKHLVSSENYPENFPSVEELVKLKIYFKDLFAVQCGNFFEEFHFEIKPELFICTSFKSSDYFEYKRLFGSEDNIATFYPFIISRCCLFPQIKPENVFDMPVGNVKKICENILINSKYKSSCTITKL